MRTLALVLPIAAAAADILAIVALVLRTEDRRLARAFVLAATTLVAWDLQLPLESAVAVAGTYGALVHLVQCVAIFVPATIFHTAFECSGARPKVRPLLFAGYGIAAILALLQMHDWIGAGFVVYAWGAVPRPGPLYPAALAFAAVWLGLGILLCARTLGEPVAPRMRLRAKYWLLAAATAFPLGATEALASCGWPIAPIWCSGSFCMAGLIVYGAVRRRLMDLDVFVTKASATLIATMILALPVAGIMVWTLYAAFSLLDCLLLGLLTMAGIVTVAVFPDIRSHLEREIASSLFPARLAARDALLRFSRDVVRLPGHADLGSKLLQTLHESLYLNGAALYLRRPGADAFFLACAEGEIHAPALIDATRLAETEEPPTIQLAGALDGRWAAVEPWASSWEACVPVWTDGACLAFMALAAKRSGAGFDEAELTLLTVLAAQLAIALKNAEYVDEVERQKAAIEQLQRRLEAENVSLRAEVRSVSQFAEIIGSSGALQRVLALVERAAPSDASVLIAGETGTGKELIARALHELSPRRAGPLISINCSAIPRSLAESELFGHERGAFTDAVSEQPGKFELADHGTIFLDEIADLPLELQAKLLRVLQERVVERIGGRALRRLDLRVVAATNHDLQADMRAGRFREDLYYRLATVVVQLPPLRERVEDIPILASYFLQRAAAAPQRAITGFTPEAMDALCRYRWPGNIRELQNVVERAALICTDETIRPQHLSDIAKGRPRSLGSAIRDEKRRRVEQALAQTGGNQAAAARLLGMRPSNLARLMKTVGAKLPPIIQ